MRLGKTGTIHLSRCEYRIVKFKKWSKIGSYMDGPDVIRTHDLPVISRAHHRAMLRARFCLIL